MEGGWWGGWGWGQMVVRWVGGGKVSGVLVRGGMGGGVGGVGEGGWEVGWGDGVLGECAGEGQGG